MRTLENKIKIIKENNKVIKVELNGQELKGITNVKINNDYTYHHSAESIIVEISNISLLEIIEN